ncbi:MAG: glutamate-cysteine ligase family protein [Polyangiales bacterium]
MATPEDGTLLRGDLDELLLPMHEAEKPRSAFAVGTEHEKPALLADTLAPAPYDGPRGIRRVLEELAARHGWIAESEYEGGPLLALKRGRASVTLEPAAQLELSGAPLRTIHEMADEMRTHLAELAPIASELGLVFLGIGFHPFATHAELPWVPKLRYGVMREYLPTRSPTGLDMMRRTSTVQANLDFENEHDAMEKLVVALRLQPIVTAMFANSPFVEGRPTGERSHRAHVWVHMDPDRSGLLPFAWSKETPTYRDYVEWALDVPMFLVKRGQSILPNTQQTFRTFLREGRDGVRATRGDWETHLNTLFPEARLKRTLEMRGADAQGAALWPALPALFKGLLYDDEARRGAAALASRLSYASVHAAREDIARRALRAELQGRSVGEWASDVLSLAESGLRRIGDLDASGRDESIHLAPLRALVDAGDSPADALLRHLEGAADVPRALVEATKLV